MSKQLFGVRVNLRLPELGHFVEGLHYSVYATDDKKAQETVTAYVTSTFGNTHHKHPWLITVTQCDEIAVLCEDGSFKTLQDAAIAKDSADNADSNTGNEGN